ncbi:MAG: hypothetical protein ACREEM_01665 [Blastocatellia bacterium]
MPIRIDDLSIPDDDLLWRRLRPDWVIPTEDGFRISSAAFKDGRHEVSVDLAAQTTQEKTLAGFPNQGLAEIKAGFPRSLGHAIIRDPIVNNPAHALICEPLDQPNRKRERDAKEMARQASILKMPAH